MSEDELQAIFKAAVIAAIKSIGLSAFKRTSLFGSNDPGQRD